MYGLFFARFYVHVLYMSNTTSIFFTPDQKEILKKAASYFGLRWQTYLKTIGLEHAKKVLRGKKVGLGELIEASDSPRMEIFDHGKSRKSNRKTR